MFRRCVSTLVLLGFVAGQLAAVPHAHGGYSPEEQQEHDVRPHIHVGGHSHDHNHSQGGHSHDHSSGPRSPVNTDQVSGRGWGPRVDHEADAVYLPRSVSSPAVVEGQRTLLITANPIASDATLLLPLPETSAPVHPPDAQSPGAKIFLKLRNLRI